MNHTCARGGSEKRFETDDDNNIECNDDAQIENLITIYGTVMGQQVTVLKDDGCNTNVISKSFVDRHRSIRNIRKGVFFDKPL